MSPYASTLDIASEAFSRNRADMFGLLDELQKIKERAAALSERRRPRFDERGQLTPRERLQRLLDPGMPFLELYALANYLLDTDDREASVPGASALSGIGFINGTRCVIFVDDSGIAAGAALAKTSDKIQACLDIAMKYKLPFVHLVESAGADLMKYAVESWAYAGRIFCKLANLSAAGIPTIAVRPCHCWRCLYARAERLCDLSQRAGACIFGCCRACACSNRRRNGRRRARRHRNARNRFRPCGVYSVG